MHLYLHTNRQSACIIFCIILVVFGNMGNDSGTGVAFSRNPSTGENIMYGEYLINAQ